MEPEWENYNEYCMDKGYAEKSLITHKLLFNLWQKIMGYSAVEFVRKAKENPELAESEFRKYVRVRRSSCSVAHLQNMRSALVVICKANKAKVDWESIPLPKGTSRSKRRPYRKEEIQTLLENVDLRTEVVITLFAGSGIRAGAIEYLTFNDIFVITEKMEQMPFLKWYKSGSDVLACRFVVYRGEPEEYVTFGTPEIARKLKRYLLEREQTGESISEQSQVLSNMHRSNEGLSPKSLCLYMERLLERKGMKDKSISPLHSFRKFYETTAERHTNPLIAEKLTGHSVGLGSAEAYIMPPEEKLLELFLKCVPDLTLDKVENVERVMKLENEDLKQRVDNIEKTIHLIFGKMLNAKELAKSVS